MARYGGDIDRHPGAFVGREIDFLRISTRDGDIPGYAFLGLIAAAEQAEQQK